jgi:glucokinase
MPHDASIGIDIGGSKSLFELFDGTMNALLSIKAKTHGDNESNFTGTLQESLRTLLKRAAHHGVQVGTIGIGCAGNVDGLKHTVKLSANIPILQGYSFRAALRGFTNAEVGVYNDVSAGLYGELKLGAAIGCKHVMMISVGTGVGGAIAIDGRLYGGATGLAGNAGHFLIDPLALVAESSRFGILDRIASRSAIAGEAAALAAKHRAPKLLKLAGTDVRNIKSSVLAKAIQSGDKAVEGLVKSRMRILGIALSSLIEFLNPEMLVLAGGLTTAMPLLVRREVEAGIKAHANPETVRALRVVTSKLKNHAVTIGAARLALDQTQ